MTRLPIGVDKLSNAITGGKNQAHRVKIAATCFCSTIETSLAIKSHKTLMNSTGYIRAKIVIARFLDLSLLVKFFKKRFIKSPIFLNSVQNPLNRIGEAACEASGNCATFRVPVPGIMLVIYSLCVCAHDFVL